MQGKSGEPPVPSKARKNLNTEDMESHGAPRRSNWLAHSALNPFSVALPRPSLVLRVRILRLVRLSDRSDGWSFTRLRCVPMTAWFKVLHRVELGRPTLPAVKGRIGGLDQFVMR